MNPFLKRATEHLSDPEAFLGLVSPEPVGVYLRPFAEQGALYDRLVLLQGTPGSGKTTIARLFTLSVVSALLRHRDSLDHRATLGEMIACRVIDDTAPRVLGYRVPLEPEYRDLWELPYADSVKVGLTKALIQARAVLGWFRSLNELGIENGAARLMLDDADSAAVASAGGSTLDGMREQARRVEKEVYDAATALVPPNLEEIDTEGLGGYRPFDVLRGVTCVWGGKHGRRAELRPLVVLDDAHQLHHEQFRLCQRWLMRRELAVSRWLLTRLDILSPEDVLCPPAGEVSTELPGITAGRDFLVIRMQGNAVKSERKARRRHRTAFRRMVRDMGDRYLKTMPTFLRLGRTSLSGLLSELPDAIPESKVERLEKSLAALIERSRIPRDQISALEASVAEFSRSRGLDIAVRHQMLRILIHRYIKRRPQGDLFEGFGEPSNPPTATNGVRNGAELQLLHAINRPYYYGIESLCDASGENVEQFLRLAGCLVEVAELNVIRQKSVVTLSATEQDRLLRARARETLEEWQFPRCQDVRKLIDRMAERCIERTLEPNAPLSSGANAFGVPQRHFETVWNDEPQLAEVLQYAVAYNAITLVPGYNQGGDSQEWCLLEICGPAVLVHGLTLERGGFIESTVMELASLLGD